MWTEHSDIDELSLATKTGECSDLGHLGEICRDPSDTELHRLCGPNIGWRRCYDTIVGPSHLRGERPLGQKYTADSPTELPKATYRAPSTPCLVFYAATRLAVALPLLHMCPVVCALVVKTKRIAVCV